jgi:hypothetical protein
MTKILFLILLLSGVKLRSLNYNCQATEGNLSLGQSLNLVVVTPSRSYTIPDAQDFRDATYQELIEIGRTEKSLATIRKEKATKATPPTTATVAVVQTKNNKE